MRRHGLRLAMSIIGASMTPGIARAQDARPATPAFDSQASRLPSASARVLTLEQAERAAIEHQPQIVAARAATHVAQGQAEQASAPLLPQVVGTASYTRETGDFASPSGRRHGAGAKRRRGSLTSRRRTTTGTSE